MKLYIAARYSRKDEIAQLAKLLRSIGYAVTSTWFDEPHDGSVQLDQVKPDNLLTYALRDMQELLAADVLLFFSESDQTSNRRGGRHVEFGVALAEGKPIHVIGPQENIFHYLPTVRHFESLTEFLAEVRPYGR